MLTLSGNLEGILVTENNFGPSFPEVYFTPIAFQRPIKLHFTLMTSGQETKAN